MDMTPQNRLVRKRNSNLQKQLDVNLQILGEEYRQTKERMYKDERECGVFLQSLYSTVPGLQAYGQPDTRAMNKNAMLRERRYSVSASCISVDDSDDDYDHHHRQNQHHNNAHPHHPPHNKNSSSTPFNRCPQPAAFPAGAGAPGAGLHTRPRSGKQDGGGGGAGRPSEPPPGKTRNRPSTAGTVRSGGVGGFGRGVGGGSQSSLSARRPSSGFGYAHRDQGPQYGRGAYTEHDRSVHDNVIQKFQFIFNPDTKTRSVNLSTTATPIVVVQPESSTTGGGGGGGGKAAWSATDASKVASNASDQNNNGVIRMNGEQFDVSKRPLHKARRVVWSANPRERQETVSAPNTTRLERPRTGGTSTSIRPASSTGRATTTVSGGSSSHMLNGRAFKPGFRSERRSSPVRLDPKVQALAHQRNPPFDYVPQTRSPEPDEVSADADDKCRKESSRVNSAYVDGCSEQRRTESPSDSLVARSLESPAPEAECINKAKEDIVLPTRKISEASTGPSKQPTVSQSHKPKGPTRKQSVTSNPHPNSKTPPPKSASQLQVPGKQESNSQSRNQHHQHHQHHHQHHHHNHEKNGVSGWSVISSSIRHRSSQDTLAPPPELVAKLMRAGSKPGSENKLHKPAPSKSELSHRSMPAPRQTVAGILAQIENQKASTRYMLSASRDLQKVVKKLVPWEQNQDEYDYDDL